MAKTTDITAVRLGADVATSRHGVTETGARIGVVSDSFNAKAGAGMAVGVLPGVTILGDGSAERRRPRSTDFRQRASFQRHSAAP